ncbi:hypothetical protein GCM10009775_11850 [Microbacterium aoyamense]|uniref:Uncharacterized protein n=1 Tax=Microbacterium aoyamense TaxID=344166 RepID=A0ABP5ARN9_9MICO|nr:cell wall-binding repeat-containing protein [Microbacterium aoyamense]
MIGAAIGVVLLVATVSPAAADSGATATLSGRIAGADGRLLGSCAVLVASQGGVVSGWTQPELDGTYEIAGLAPGEYDVRISYTCTGRSLIGEWGDGTHGATQQTPTVLAAGTNPLDIRLDDGGFITGTLTGSGEPLSGDFALIPLEPVFPGPPLRVFARSGVISSTPLPPGRYGVVFSPGIEWIGEDHNGIVTTTPTAPPLTVGLGQTVTVAADLQPAGVLSGTVFVTKNGTRMPAAGARVRIEGLDGARSTSASADENGRWMIRGVSGRFRISFSSESSDPGKATLPEYLGGGRSKAESRIVEVRDNAIVDGLDADLDIGGHFSTWPYLEPSPGAALLPASSQLADMLFFRLDEASGEYVRIDPPGWRLPIGGHPYTGVLEPGTYALRVWTNHWLGGDPWAQGAETIRFYGGLDDIVVREGEVTPYEPLILETRHYDVTRAAGTDRYATSAAISAGAFDPGVPVAYLANGTTFPDALAGAAAAGSLGGPVLLTPAGGIPPVVANELDRLNPQRIVLLGGASVVSEAVERQAAAYSSAPVTRQAGGDRFATSAAISKSTFLPGVPVVYLANGYDFPDALAGAAAAGSLGGPVLLTSPSGLSAPLHAELDRLKPHKIVVLGGKAAVSDAVATQAGAYTSGSVTRHAGASRFATAAQISAKTFSPGVPVTYIANGYGFPDALSGAAVAGARGGPVLLTGPQTMPDAILAELERLDPEKVVILGGEGAVSPDVMSQTRAVLPY